MNELIKKKYYPLFLAGTVLPVFTWFVVISFYRKPINLQSLYFIHCNNPAIIICDFFPVLLFFIIFSFNKFFLSEQKKTQSDIKYLQDNIKQNLEFAKKIGEGKYDPSIEIKKDDYLGISLKIMQENLLAAYDKETKQFWISTGKEKISGLLREMDNIDNLSYNLLVELIKYTGLIQGAFYFFDEEKNLLVNKATYAYNRKKYLTQEFQIGKGLIGQAAYEQATIYKKDLPKNYATITSGILSDKTPACILIVPLIAHEKLQGVIELATLKEEIPSLKIDYIEEVCEIAARTIFNMKVNMRTEKLLQEAQLMTEELRENDERLQKNAVEMEITHEKIEEANRHLEMQVQLVENSKKRLYSLLENASEVISIYNPDGTVLYESPSVINILGYSPDEIIGTDGFARVHNTQSEDIQHLFARLLMKPEMPQKIEFQFKMKTGKIIWLESIGRNLLNNSAIEGIIFNTRDISERKLIEKEQRKRGQMQALSENSPDMIIRLSPDGTFYYVNPVIEKYTFTPPLKFFQKNLNDMSLEDEIRDMLWGVIENINVNRNKLQLEYEFESLFEKKVMQVNAIPEYNDEKELESILIVAHDITEQKQIEEEIREKNKNITESINYAKRIQTSIIPTVNNIKEHLKQSFILYKPKDIISGDFPWFYAKDNYIYIAAVDCTGHGVPGALLSFIGYFLLNNIVDYPHDLTAGEILNLLHNGVRKTLKQEVDKPGSHDGMDIALCKIDLQKNVLQYAGAHRSLLFLRNSELTEYKGDRKPIGGTYVYKKSDDKFSVHTIDLLKNDKIFFYTDGLPDQYGGQKMQKYSSARIKEGIIKNAGFSINQFSNYFANEFSEWKGNLKQIDDVLMIGIEF